MTHFLSSDANPEGHKLEDVLKKIRNDIIYRATKIMDDNKPEAQHVLNNNLKILNYLSQSIELAENSTEILDKSFGHKSSSSPRIGKV
ncbi:MAG: histidine kinase [Kordiimonadaceae bacterium]|jgi:hypothetical protein|nr:histidine kinase [Kordiimonadaceae bacterium]